LTLVPETLARYDFKKNRYDFTDSTDKTLKRKKNFKRSFNTFLQAFELILFWYKRFLDSFKKVNLERMNHLKHKLMTTRYQKALSKQKKYQTFLRLLFCISANRKFIRNPVILKNWMEEFKRLLIIPGNLYFHPLCVGWKFHFPER